MQCGIQKINSLFKIRLGWLEEMIVLKLWSEGKKIISFDWALKHLIAIPKIGDLKTQGGHLHPLETKYFEQTSGAKKLESAYIKTTDRCKIFHRTLLVSSLNFLLHFRLFFSISFF